jgi:hypothetical protein
VWLLAAIRQHWFILATVAENQLPNYESGGQEFESLRARQKFNKHQHNLNAGKGAMQNKIICMASAWQRGRIWSRIWSGNGERNDGSNFTRSAKPFPEPILRRQPTPVRSAYFGFLGAEPLDFDRPSAGEIVLSQAFLLRGSVLFGHDTVLRISIKSLFL